jgi:C-terminal processing protease CtpA/Prc
LGLAGYGPWGWGGGWGWGPHGYGYYDPYDDGYWRDYGYYDRPAYDDSYAYSTGGAFLGVTFDMRYRDEAVVESVYDHSPAADVGLQPGDTIDSINGRAMRSPYDVMDLIGQMQPGERVSIRLSQPEARTLEVTLGTRE